MQLLPSMTNLLTIQAQKTPVISGYLFPPLGELATQGKTGKTRTKNTEISSSHHAGGEGFKRLNQL